MEIKIDGKYHVTGDPRQYILHEKSGKNESCYYFTSLGSLARSFIHKKIRGDAAIQTLKQLQQKIDQYGDQIESAFKNSLTS